VRHRDLARVRCSRRPARGRAAGNGLVTGDAIAIHSGNRREYFELMTAAAHVGLRYVLVNWHWTAEELGYVLADSGARAVFSEDAFAGVAAEAAVDTPVRVGIGEVPGFVPYEEFLAGGPDGEPADQVLGWPMIYTSGTTGRPKGVKRALMTPGAPLETLVVLAGAFGQVLRIPERVCCGSTRRPGGRTTCPASSRSGTAPRRARPR
jgi:long-chain acyl-CoA synthetase